MTIGSVMKDVAKRLNIVIRMNICSMTDEGRHTKVCSVGGGGSGTKGTSIGLSENRESELDRDDAAVEADNASIDRRILTVKLLAESQVDSDDRLPFNIIVTVFRHATTRRKQQPRFRYRDY